VQDEFGKDVQILNNQGRSLPKVDILRWTEKQHDQHFKVYYANNNDDPRNAKARSHSTTAFIIHRIRSSKTLYDIKTPKVLEHLRENNCYVSMHRWSEDVWNTTQLLGFMIGYDPNFYSTDQAMMKIVNDLTKLLPCGAKIPKFQLASASPTTQIGNQTARTKAYAIETERDSAITMLKVLKLAYNITTLIMLRVTILLHAYYFFEVDYSVHVEMHI
jgi:hypothetical protein